MNNQIIIDTFNCIISIIKYYGKSDIVNTKRQETFEYAINIIKESEDLIDEKTLSKKPASIVKELKASGGKIKLDDKPPYGGIVIENGKIIDKIINNKISAFKNLQMLTGLGIGIGNSIVAELVELGYHSIDDLNKEYTKSKFNSFRKGIQGPLRYYFEGLVRTNKMTREQATDWKLVIDRIIEDVAGSLKKPIKYKIAGSYARKKQEIGDIDYVITMENSDDLYNALKSILNLMEKIKKITGSGSGSGSSKIKLVKVDETPKKPKPGVRYASGMKLWYDRIEDSTERSSSEKVKIEIYGYAQPEDDFCFAYFARAGDVTLQKKIKWHASKKGYRLGPWGLDKKGLDESIFEDLDTKELLKKRTNNDKITTIADIFNFLEFRNE